MKTHWNYRVLAFQFGEDVYFEICEVHYKNNKPNAYAAKKCNVFVSSEEGIESMYEMLDNMKIALSKPILWGGDKFPKEYNKQES